MFEEPKDIFAGVDSPAQPPVAPPPTAPSPSPAPAPAPVTLTPPSSAAAGRGLLSVFLPLFLIIVVVAAGAYWYLTNVSPSPLVENVDLTPAAETDTTPEKVPASSAPAVVTDTDGDGLSDTREAEVGTSLTLSDTDADGLGDKEELDVYGTDPLRADTDSDTYPDGEEVKNGYNPNGSGKLFNLPSVIEDK